MGWISLNGEWDFAIDENELLSTSEEVVWDKKNPSAFAPETPASGLSITGYFQACWYRRQFKPPVLTGGQRLIIHFGAVDHIATLWINGKQAVRHEGGYTPFSADITDLLQQGNQTIVVRAEDDPLDLSKPRGKAGLAVGSALDLVLSHQRYLADSVVGGRAETSIGYLRWTPNVPELGNRFRSANCVA